MCADAETHIGTIVADRLRGARIPPALTGRPEVGWGEVWSFTCSCSWLRADSWKKIGDSIFLRRERWPRKLPGYGRGPLTTPVLHSASVDVPTEGGTAGGVIGPVDKLVLRCGSSVRIPTQIANLEAHSGAAVNLSLPRPPNISS